MLLALLVFFAAAEKAPQFNAIPTDAKLVQAMKAHSCKGLDNFFATTAAETDAERAYIKQCWAAEQKKLVTLAMRAQYCTPVLALPGVYPLGTAEERRYVYNCWLKARQQEMDACIGLHDIGDATSAPLIVETMKRTPPVRTDNDHKLHLLDTHGACMDVLQRVQKLTDADLRARARTWGPLWREWADQQ